MKKRFSAVSQPLQLLATGLCLILPALGAAQEKPTAQWDEALGQTWITPAQLVTFIYNRLLGVTEYTRIEANTRE